MKEIRLQGKNIILRKINWKADLEMICKWNSDPLILSFIEQEEIEPRNLQQTRQLYEYFDANGLLFIADYKESGPIGEVWVNKEKVPEPNACRINVLVGEKQLWDKGLGTDILRTVLEHCFQTMRQRSVYALDVDPLNFRALRLYVKCGFIPYQVEMTSIIKGGQPVAEMSLRLTRKRFEVLQAFLTSLPY